MKKDIQIPEVENVFLAAVQEWSDELMQKVWYVHLVNDSDFDLDSVMVVSKAFGMLDGEMKKTSLLRHAFIKVPSVSVVKIELLDDSVLRLNNEFMITYFIDNTLYDKKFIFKAQSITPDYVEEVPILFVDGVIVR
jgi:hypothetical protein